MNPDPNLPPSRGGPRRPPRAGVVVVAAGRGTRFGGELPKQFLPLGSMRVFEHALGAFASAPGVVRIVVVGPAEGVPDGVPTRFPALEALASARLAAEESDGFAPSPESDAAPHPPPFEIRWVAGGARRQDSTLAGLRALTDPPELGLDVALVHDAARPFPPVAALAPLVARALESGGALLAIPATDTIKRAAPDGTVAETLDRSELRLAQTPQAIRADRLASLARLLRSEREFTDESAALESLGVRVALVAGSTENFKITRADDLLRAEALLRGRSAP